MTAPRPTRSDVLDDVARARAGVRLADVRETRPSRTDGRTSAGSRWRGFVRRYGWRAYALPVLAIVTVVALVQGSSGGSGDANASGTGGGASTTAGPTAPPPAQASTVLKQDTGGSNASVLAAAALPAGPAYDTTGDGTFRILKGTSKVFGKTGKLWRFSIDVENGLTGIDLTQFQDTVVTTLGDSRSWSGHGVRLQRVDSGQIDFHVTLTASLTVRKFCGYDIKAESSCYAAAGSVAGLSVSRVFMNDARWVRGAAAYVGDLSEYRVYMINHEDGHALGHNHAHECLPDGQAPAMMQQTFGLRSTLTGKFCTANPWPYPPNATGAPGAEQPDTDANNEYGRGD